MSHGLCLACGTQLCKTINGRKNVYCNNACQANHNYTSFIDRWKVGKEAGWTGKTRQISHHIRRYLLFKGNYSCCRCGWNARHPVDDLPLVEINHIDGNAENCSEDNLELLCPNCHSMTPNFRARNRDSKRNRKPDLVSGKPAVL